jgi:hypothetical protein
MENLVLTRWLQMVWDALAEQDQAKRDRLLQGAGMLHGEDNTPPAGVFEPGRNLRLGANEELPEPKRLRNSFPGEWPFDERLTT